MVVTLPARRVLMTLGAGATTVGLRRECVGCNRCRHTSADGANHEQCTHDPPGASHLLLLSWVSTPQHLQISFYPSHRSVIHASIRSSSPSHEHPASSRGQPALSSCEILPHQSGPCTSHRYTRSRVELEITIREIVDRAVNHNWSIPERQKIDRRRL